MGCDPRVSRGVPAEGAAAPVSPPFAPIIASPVGLYRHAFEQKICSSRAVTKFCRHAGQHRSNALPGLRPIRAWRLARVRRSALRGIGGLRVLLRVGPALCRGLAHLRAGFRGVRFAVVRVLLAADRLGDVRTPLVGHAPPRGVVVARASSRGGVPRAPPPASTAGSPAIVEAVEVPMVDVDILPAAGRARPPRPTGTARAIRDRCRRTAASSGPSSADGPSMERVERVAGCKSFTCRYDPSRSMIRWSSVARNDEPSSSVTRNTRAPRRLTPMLYMRPIVVRFAGGPRRRRDPWPTRSLIGTAFRPSATATSVSPVTQHGFVALIRPSSGQVCHSLMVVSNWTPGSAQVHAA